MCGGRLPRVTSVVSCDSQPVERRVLYPNHFVYVRLASFLLRDVLSEIIEDSARTKAGIIGMVFNDFAESRPRRQSLLAAMISISTSIDAFDFLEGRSRESDPGCQGADGVCELRMVVEVAPPGPPGK